MSELSKSTDSINGKPKITRVLLVRHGSTEFQSEDRFAGAVDVELSEEGKTTSLNQGIRKRTMASTMFGRTTQRNSYLGRLCKPYEKDYENSRNRC